MGATRLTPGEGTDQIRQLYGQIHINLDDFPSVRRFMPAYHHIKRQRGAILLKSLVALAVLSLCAMGTLIALERMEITSQSLRQLSTNIRAQNNQVGSANMH